MNKDLITRIKQIIDHYGLSQSDFARRAGIRQPNLSAILKGERPCGTGIVNKILLSFDINKNWLLSGEGEMLRQQPQNEIEDLTPEEREQLDAAIADGRVTFVPLINIDSVGGIHSSNALDSSEQYCERMIPFPAALPGDVAILQSGNSMSPTIPSGAILQIRRVEGWREYFGYGNDFVLWLSDDRRITKQVLKYEPDPKNYVTCHSYNPESADEELPKSMIKEVWKVINVLINKGW